MDIDLLIKSGGNIYQTYIPEHDLVFTFRLLTLKEYEVFRKLGDGGVLPPYSLAEEVFNRCFLGDPELISGNIPAGVTISIGQLILFLSGEVDPETLKKEIAELRAQHEVDDITTYMQAVILEAFPTYTLSDIDSWTRNDLVRHFVLAENVLCKRDSKRQPLDLKAIKTRQEVERGRKTSHGINFEEENKAIRRAVGASDIEEAQAGKLSRRQLGRLSRRA
jgi:hypothetical protein